MLHLGTDDYGCCGGEYNGCQRTYTRALTHTIIEHIHIYIYDKRILEFLFITGRVITITVYVSHWRSLGRPSRLRSYIPSRTYAYKSLFNNP